MGLTGLARPFLPVKMEPWDSCQAGVWGALLWWGA